MEKGFERKLIEIARGNGESEGRILEIIRGDNRKKTLSRNIGGEDRKKTSYRNSSNCFLGIFALSSAIILFGSIIGKGLYDGNYAQEELDKNQKILYLDSLNMHKDSTNYFKNWERK